MDWASTHSGSDPTGIHSALNAKVVTVSSVANGTSPDSIQALPQPAAFHPLNVVEPFTGVGISRSMEADWLTVAEDRLY